MNDNSPTDVPVDLPYEFNGVRYRWRLTREAVDHVCHYCHWIPVNRGFTQQFFSENHPGGELGQFMAAFKAAGVLLRDEYGAPIAGRCHWRVKHLYFTDTDSYVVEWDETVTEDDHRFFWTGHRDQTTTGRGSVHLKLTGDDYAEEGRLSEIAHAIHRELGGTSGGDSDS